MRALTLALMLAAPLALSTTAAHANPFGAYTTGVEITQQQMDTLEVGKTSQDQVREKFGAPGRREQLGDAVARLLTRLVAQLRSGQQPPGRGGKLQVLVLGRYNRERACIPADWREYTVRRVFRKAVYNIHVSNETNACRGVKSITVDGQRIEGTLLPLFNDGEHRVEVVL